MVEIGSEYRSDDYLPEAVDTPASLDPTDQRAGLFDAIKRDAHTRALTAGIAREAAKGVTVSGVRRLRRRVI